MCIYRNINKKIKKKHIKIINLKFILEKGQALLDLANHANLLGLFH
jgi:hypothetical protein